MKKLLFLFLGLILLAGCTTTASNPTTFSYQKTNYNLVVGATERLYPTITNLSEVPSVTYSTSDPNVIVIEQESNYYVLRAVGVGSATITARLNNVQGKVCTLVASVTAAPTLEIAIEGEDTITLEEGDTQNFTITSNITYTDILAWGSSDELVGTISATGEFSALAVGSTTITAIVGSATDQVTVNVVEVGSIIDPTSIEVYGDDQVIVGETLSLTVVADVTGDFATTFSSSNTSIATVDSSGVVTGVAAGTAVILVSLADYPSVIQTKTITVITAVIDATGLTLSGPTSVNTGATISLTATIAPTGATGTVIYSSSDEAVATVSSSGVVTGVAEGSATITATLEENSLILDTYEITVNYVAPTLTGITITGPTSVQVGSTIELEAEAVPLGADNSVTWMSLSTSKATVNATTGVVTGVTTGTVTITAISTVNSQIIGYKEITVTPGPSISASASSNTLFVGETVTVTGTVINSSNTGVTYSSSNILVATVNTTTGVVTGIAAGSVTIIATADVNPSLVATVDLVVSLAPSISVSPTEASIAIGQTTTIVATVENLSNTSVTWESSATGIATVNSSGVVTGVAVGSATITATSVEDNNLTATASITVVLSPTISIAPTTASVVAGETVTVTATVHNSSNTGVTYASSNEAVATVNSSGIVTGLTAGSVTITATADVDSGLTATASITVTPAPTITMVPTSATINQNETTTLVATVENSSNTDVTYSSSNASIATVNATTGVVTGVAQGNVTITATADVNSSLTATCTITVNPAPTIVVAPTSATLAIAATQQLTATVSYSSNTNVTWSSSATGVATVNSSGLVTAVAAGSATITATAAVNASLTATCTITVNPADYTINYTLNSGAWAWSTGTVTPASGIDSVSTLPEIFMQDYYKYLYDNNKLSATTVAVALRKTTWVDFSSSGTDPRAWYNHTTGISYKAIDGYSQFFWDTISGKVVTGGFFGTEPYKSKYATLFEIVYELYQLKIGAPTNSYPVITSNDSTTGYGRSGFGFILDGYFYGTQGVTGTLNDTLFTSLRSAIPTPVLRYYVSGSTRTSAAVTYQITSYPYGQTAALRAPVRNGYVFEGWYNNSGFTGSPIATIAAGVAPASMYYAKWTAITSYGGGGTNPTSLTVTATKTSFAVSETSQLSVTGGYAVTWSSGATPIATVNSSGLVTGVAAGTVTITATLVADTNVKGTITLTVTAAAGALTVKVQRDSSNGGSTYANPSLSPLSLALGATVGYYQVWIWDASQAPVSRTACTMTSSNTSALTISTYGSITVKASSGTVTINVTFGTNTGSVTVTLAP